MNFSLKSIASAVVLAVAVSGAHAAVDTGLTSGNGELFFSVWDASGSYTFDLNKTLNGFQSDVAAAGNIDKTYSLTGLSSFLSDSSRSGALMFNLVAVDNRLTANADGSSPFNNLRLLTTYTTKNAPTTANNAMKSVIGNISIFADKVNGVIGASDNVAVGSSSAAYAGQVGFKDNSAGLQGFSNGGTFANNSFASGLNLMRVDALGSGTLKSVYTDYVDNGTSVKVWVNGTDLHIGAVAAVPEPESYAMLLAGLGMIGFMARRRQNAA